MPAQQQTVSLKGKFGQSYQQAAAKHAKDPIRYGRQSLPPWIKNGIARLVEIYVSEYDQKTEQKQLDGSSAAGEAFVRMVGTVVEPKVHQHNGSSIPVEGLQTSQVIPICRKGVSYRGNPCTFEDCIAEVQNEIRAIAGEDFDASDIDAAITLLATKKPLFRFSTTETKSDKINPKTKRPYEPRTWENWLGSKGLENYVPRSDSGMKDNGSTPDAPAGDGVSNHDEPLNETNSDLDSLVGLADGEEDTTEAVAARARLKEMAFKLGMDNKLFDKTDNWAGVADFIREKDTGEATGDEGSSDDGEFLPEKGQIYKYKYRDDKGNPVKDTKTKKEKSAVQVEIITVDADAKVVTVKDMEAGKTIVGSNKKAIKIPFDHLDGDE